MPVEPGLGDIGASIVRTVTPIIIGVILAVVGTDVAGVDEASLTPVISALLAALWHALVRLLESKWPKMGWLLGLPKKPVYVTQGS